MCKRWLFSYALLTSSFLSFSLSAECIPSPDCTDLGYDKTSCPTRDGVLKCPFDTTKVKCVGNTSKTCEVIGKKTCGELCVTESFWGCCNDSDCATGQICNLERNNCYNLAKVGDIYYTDGTYSTELDNSKVPIGVVGHITNGGKKGVVVALDTAYDNKSPNSGIQWGCHGTDLSLTNYTYQSTALNDFSGKTNTDVIASQCGTNTAAYYCKNTYSKGGVSGWYLPAYGELYAILYTNFNTVNTGLGKISSNNQISSGYWHWSSSEYDNNRTWLHYSGYTNNGTNYKNDYRYFRCVLAF